MNEPTIEDTTSLYCWDCGHIETAARAIWEYDGYADEAVSYCSKCGHRSYTNPKSEVN